MPDWIEYYFLCACLNCSDMKFVSLSAANLGHSGTGEVPFNHAKLLQIGQRNCPSLWCQLSAEFWFVATVAPRGWNVRWWLSTNLSRRLELSKFLSPVVFFFLMPWLSFASHLNPSPNFVFFSLFIPYLTADDKLFKKIQANNNHCLHQFLRSYREKKQSIKIFIRENMILYFLLKMIETSSIEFYLNNYVLCSNLYHSSDYSVNLYFLLFRTILI